MKQPMMREVGLDYSTRTCPCGASIRGDVPPLVWKKWLFDHFEHCDGTEVSITTDAGASVYDRKPEPVRIKISRPDCYVHLLLPAPTRLIACGSLCPDLDATIEEPRVTCPKCRERFPEMPWPIKGA